MLDPLHHHNHWNPVEISFPQSRKVIISCPGLIYELHAPRRLSNKCVGRGGGEGRQGPAPKRGAVEEQRGILNDEGVFEELEMEGWWLFEVSVRTEGSFVSKPPTRAVHITAGQWPVKLRTERG